MTPDEARMELARWTTRPPAEQLDHRIRALLRVSRDAATHPTTNRRFRGWTYAAALALMVFGLAAWLWERNAPTVVWAQVDDALRSGKAAETAHFIQRAYTVNPNVAYGEVVSTSEVWLKRPGQYRSDEETFIAEHLNDTYVPAHRMTYLYNEAGEWVIDHTTKRFGRRAPEVVVAGRTPASTADYIQQIVNGALDRQFQYPGGLPKDAPGQFLGEETLQGERVRKYRFEGPNGDWSTCWFNAEELPVKVEWGPKDATKAILEYDQIEFDVAVADERFTVPADYANGQRLGVEDRPGVIHPDKVVMEASEHGVRFWRRDTATGTPDDDASKATPAIDVHFDRELIGVLNIGGKDYSTAAAADGSKRSVHITNGREPLGGRYWLVRPDLGNDSPVRLRLEQDANRNEQNPAVVELITYCTDRIRATIAYDADRDGEYDAWATIAEPPLPQP